MAWSLFAKKDPICGMKQEKGKGLEKNGMWFCSQNCVKKYDGGQKEMKPGSCCGGH